MNGQKLTLAQYASRMNIKMLRPADFNKKLREHGVPKEVSVQKICKVSRDEKQVREILDEIWKTPEQAKEKINEVLERNKDIFEFEHILLDKSTSRHCVC